MLPHVAVHGKSGPLIVVRAGLPTGLLCSTLALYFLLIHLYLSTDGVHPSGTSWSLSVLLLAGAIGVVVAFVVLPFGGLLLVMRTERWCHEQTRLAGAQGALSFVRWGVQTGKDPIRLLALLHEHGFSLSGGRVRRDGTLTAVFSTQGHAVRVAVSKPGHVSWRARLVFRHDQTARFWAKPPSAHATMEILADAR